MFKPIIFLLFLITPTVIKGEVLTFEILHRHTCENPYFEGDGKEIHIRGFYYETEEGRAVLASRPGIRSCCVGKKDPVHTYLFLEKKIVGCRASQVVELTGVFKVSSQKDAQGNLVALYHLLNPQICTLSAL